MKFLKSTGIFSGAGILSAFAASLCCITPLVALLAGSSSIAANLSWIVPARPYLIGLSITVIAFAWYMKLKPVQTNNPDCHCENTKKVSFIQSGTFLSVVTVFAVLMMAFPLYAKVFYPKPKIQAAKAASINSRQEVKFNIQGMTCESCEEHVNNALSKVNGVLDYKTSYADKSAVVTYDNTKVEEQAIEAVINKTGYLVSKDNKCDKDTSCSKGSGKTCCDNK